MPTFSVATALALAYSHVGMPWNFHAWQEITGITDSLIPDDDCKLPTGISHADATEIATYFDVLDKKGTRDERLKFSRAKNDRYLGRVKWNAWVSRRYSQWGIHNLTVNAMKENRCHPHLIMKADQLDTWPDTDFIVNIVQPTLGFVLFGDEGLNELSMVKAPLRELVTCIILRTLVTLKANFGRMKKTANEYREAAECAYSDVTAVGVNITVKKLRKAFRLVEDYAEYARLIGTKEEEDHFERLLGQLSTLLQATSRSKSFIGRPGTGGLSKYTRLMLEQLAKEDDVSDLEAMYLRLANRADTDLGVEEESSLGQEKLEYLLCFPHGRPSLFNDATHHNGFTPWQDANTFQESPADLDPLKLRWHQLVGVKASIRMSFLAQPQLESKSGGGLLIADEVGLGKTAQQIAFNAFVNQVAELQTSSGALPPAIAGTPFYCGLPKIPDLPHLFIVPGSLVEQVLHEHHVFLKPHSVDVFTYNGTAKQKAEFWSKNGPYKSSKHGPRHRIIIASHSALVSDALRAFDLSGHQKRHRKELWVAPRKKPGAPATIFDLSFLNVCVDEAHHMRNVNSKYWAVLAMRDRAVMLVATTATPLHTSPKDIIALGRMIGIPYFLHQEPDDLDREDRRRITKLKKLMKAEQCTKATSLVPLQPRGPDNELAEGTSGEISVIQYYRVKQFQSCFLGRMIRRTVHSKNFEGKSIIPLPPYVHVDAVLRLQDWECPKVGAMNDSACEKASDAISMGQFTQSAFFLQYRISLGWAGDDDQRDRPERYFKTQDDWRNLGSAKITAAVLIAHHLLCRDDAPPIVFDGQGGFEIPALPDVPLGAVMPGRTRKVLIYQEWPSQSKLLVLKLWKIGSVCIHGKLSFAERSKIINRFRSIDPSGPRVLIFSAVGTVGLNLAVSDTLIMLDQPWSAQEERQIIGRAWRQPQSKVVYAYSLRAMGTTDVLMSTMARGKAFLLEAFAGSSNLVNTLKGIAIENDVDHAVETDKQNTKLMHDQPSNKEKHCSNLVKPKSQKRKADFSSRDLVSKRQRKHEANRAQLTLILEEVGVKENTSGLAMRPASYPATVSVMLDQDQTQRSVHGSSNESSLHPTPGSKKLDDDLYADVDFTVTPDDLHDITEDVNAPGRTSKPKSVPVVRSSSGSLLMMSSTNHRALRHAGPALTDSGDETSCVDEGQQRTVEKGNISDEDEDCRKTSGLILNVAVQ
ncbi:P-loop containing nucleoside triphosphate hydrolase protein [Pisolithus sp. B1]|nr:P-loop containing nucleoside triphosphate hydrolase protein [Pisolithus sp. B1]